MATCSAAPCSPPRPSWSSRSHWWGNAAGLFGSAHDSWQILRGLRTLPLRVDRQEASARAIAAALAEEPEVLEVYYPGLESHPDFDLAGASRAARAS